MRADEKFGQAKTKAKRPTHFPARSRTEADGRDFNPAATMGAKAGHRSRCLNRANVSPLIHSHSISTGGTVNRPYTRVSRGKQTASHQQGRNVSSQSFVPLSTRISAPGRSNPPGTGNRVNAYVSYRKQTIEHTLTRNVPVHRYSLNVFVLGDEFARLLHANAAAPKAAALRLIPSGPEVDQGLSFCQISRNWAMVAGLWPA